MKKNILAIAITMFCMAISFGQSPNKFQYQVVVMNGSTPAANTTVGVRVQITNAAGTTVYFTEDHLNQNTNAAGQVVLTIGAGTQVGTPTFASLAWKSNNYYIRFATKVGSGAITSPVFGATSQLLSVPYALHANTATTATTATSATTATTATTANKLSYMVSVLDYGANRAQAGDDTAAVLAAIAANPGKKIFFPAGWYSVSQEIVLNSAVELIGETGTTLQPVNCNGITINVGGVVIRDMFIFGYGSTVATGITSTSPTELHYLTIKNVRLQNFTTAVKLVNTWDVVIDGVYTTINPTLDPRKIQTGLGVYGHSVNNHVSNCSFLAEKYGVEVSPTGTIGTDFKRPEGLMISNSFIGGGQYGIYSEGIVFLGVSNCVIDLTSVNTVCLKNVIGGSINNSYIYVAGVASNAVTLYNTTDVKFLSNHIRFDNSNIGISIGGSSKDNNFVGNTVEFLGTASATQKHMVIDNSSTRNIIQSNSLKWYPESTIAPVIDYQGTYPNTNIIKDNTPIGTSTGNDSSSGSNFVSVVSYGADPRPSSIDNYHDDTVAIQNAINENPGKIIFFPKGEYVVSTTIQVNGTKLMGEGKEFGTTEISAFGCDAFNLNSGSIENMFIAGDGSTLNKTAVKISTATGVVLKDIVIQHFTNGINILNSGLTTLDNVSTRVNAAAVVQVGNAISVSGCLKLNVVNCNFSSNTQGPSFVSTNEVTMTNNTISCAGNNAINLNNSNDFSIANNVIILSRTPSSATTVSHINLTNSSFYNTINGNVLKWSAINTIKPCILNNNTTRVVANSYAAPTSNNTITSNIFK